MSFSRQILLLHFVLIGRDVVHREQSQPITQLLLQWAAGDKGCLDQLVVLLESELRSIARRYMRLERPGNTLQTTALINEAYLRLVNQRELRSQHRSQFFALAARVMRHILLDHARGVRRGKRGDGFRMVPFDEACVFAPKQSAGLIALDEALSQLANIDARKAKVVELRYFGGMSVEEVAESLRVHSNTVVRDWNLAKAWLKRQMSKTEPDSACVDAG